MTIGYYWPHSVVSKDMASPFDKLNDTDNCGIPRTFLNDDVNKTCRNTNEMGKQLQVIFYSPLKNYDQRMTMEVILKNADDCSSHAWTWYVESGCHPGVFTQCVSLLLNRVAEYTRCVVTCLCLWPCDYLYLKYNRLPWHDQAREELCELRFIKKQVG